MRFPDCNADPRRARGHCCRVAEQVLENVAHAAKAAGTAKWPLPTSAALLEGRMAVAVIRPALLAVGQALISLVQFLELGLGRLVAGVLVRVMLHRKLAEGAFQRRVVGRFRNPENFVIVALGH